MTLPSIVHQTVDATAVMAINEAFTISFDAGHTTSAGNDLLLVTLGDGDALDMTGAPDPWLVDQGGVLGQRIMYARLENIGDGLTGVSLENSSTVSQSVRWWLLEVQGLEPVAPLAGNTGEQSTLLSASPSTMSTGQVTLSAATDAFSLAAIVISRTDSIDPVAPTYGGGFTIVADLSSVAGTLRHRTMFGYRMDEAAVGPFEATATVATGSANQPGRARLGVYRGSTPDVVSTGGASVVGGFGG